MHCVKNVDLISLGGGLQEAFLRTENVRIENRGLSDIPDKLFDNQSVRLASFKVSMALVLLPHALLLLRLHSPTVDCQRNFLVALIVK